MTVSCFLAFDLGAESGRAILGKLAGGRLELRELHRFPNRPLLLHGHLHWNVYRIYEEILAGLRLCARTAGGGPQSVGVDTWGVDFALLARGGSLLGLPYTYRDRRTEGAMEEFFDIVPRERVYRLTGIQMLPFNTLFQLHSMARDRSPLLDCAADLLFMPDLFNYLLTGEKKSEFTFATTSQLFNPISKAWEAELLRALGLSESLMQEVAEPGTVVGTLSPSVAEEAGLGRVAVVAGASHDTAAAVAAVPAGGDGWAYISSGTWSLVGVELERPLISDGALAWNFTNEGGVGGAFRFLKNVMGLWLLQQCRRSWSASGDLGYDEIEAMARAARPFGPLIDPDWTGFLNPPDMPGAIAAFCRDTGQAVPEAPAAMARAVFESLALKYRMVLEKIGKVTGRGIDRIHVVGGGARNELLCQLTADAAGIPVLAGPYEATAAGNVLVQALGMGVINDLQELRGIVADSYSPRLYAPRRDGRWEEANARFLDLCGGHPLE